MDAMGRVLRASTATFTVGCRELAPSQGRVAPEFGALVKAVSSDGAAAYGLVYNIVVDDDAFVRQLVAAGMEDAAYIQDQRQNRQVPVVADVLVVGQGQGLAISHRLPPSPPGPLDEIRGCENAEVVRFTARHDWLRTLLAAPDAPADQLVIASLRRAAAARPPDQREVYLVSAGRELARQLAQEPARLDGILSLLSDQT